MPQGGHFSMQGAVMVLQGQAVLSGQMTLTAQTALGGRAMACQGAG